MSTIPSNFVDFLAAAPENKGTVYGFSQATGLSAAASTHMLVDAAAKGDVVTDVETRGNRSVLTASLSKRAVRRIRREQRKARAAQVHEAVKAALDEQRPQKISSLVEVTGCVRNEILDVLRAGRDADEPVFYSFNPTNSNYHVEWSTDPENVAFPPVEEPEPAEDSDAGEAGEAEGDEESADAAE